MYAVHNTDDCVMVLAAGAAVCFYSSAQLLVMGKASNLCYLKFSTGFVFQLPAAFGSLLCLLQPVEALFRDAAFNEFA